MHIEGDNGEYTFKQYLYWPKEYSRPRLDSQSTVLEYVVECETYLNSLIDEYGFVRIERTTDNGVIEKNIKFQSKFRFINHKDKVATLARETAYGFLCSAALKKINAVRHTREKKDIESHAKAVGELVEIMLNPELPQQEQAGDDSHKRDWSARDIAIQYAQEIWANDVDRKLRIGDVTRLVHEYLISLNKHYEIETIRTWIKKGVIIPDYASKPGP